MPIGRPGAIEFPTDAPEGESQVAALPDSTPTAEEVTPPAPTGDDDGWIIPS